MPDSKFPYGHGVAPPGKENGPWWLYVIELDPSIEQFQQPNSGAENKGFPSLYVGVTTKSPETRFAEHCTGYLKSARIRNNQYKRLRNDIRDEYCEKLEIQLPLTCTLEEAEKCESYLSSLLGHSNFRVYYG